MLDMSWVRVEFSFQEMQSEECVELFSTEVMELKSCMHNSPESPKSPFSEIA